MQVELQPYHELAESDCPSLGTCPFRYRVCPIAPYNILCNRLPLFRRSPAPQSSSTRTYVRICFDGLRTNRERRRVSAPWIVRSVGFWCSPVRTCCSSAVSRRVRGAVAGVCRRGVCERGFGLFARASHVEHLFDFGFGVVSDGVCLRPSMMGFVFGSLDRPFVGWRDRACRL